MPAGPEYRLHRHHSGNGAAAPAPSQEAGDDEISLQEILSVLSAQRWLILASFLAVLALAAVYTFLQDPTYQANSLLYVNKQQSAPQVGALMGLEGSRTEVANEIEILRSRTIALSVADRLMDQQVVPGTSERLSVLEPPEDERLTRFDIMHRLRETYVSVQPVSREVDLIDVIASSTQPQEAVLLADLYADEYVSYNRASSRRRMAASSEFLNDIAGRYREELALAEDTLTTFLNQEQVVAPEEEVRQLLQQVRDLRQRKYEAQLERTAARTNIRNLREEMDRITPGLAERIASSESMALGRLKREVANKTAEVEKKYARTPSLRENPEQDAELQRLLGEIEKLQARVSERSEDIVQDALQASGMVDVAGLDGELGELGGLDGEEPSDGGMDGGSGDAGELPGRARGAMGRLNSLQQQMTNLEIAARAQEARLEVINENLATYTAQLSDIPNKEVVLGRLERSMETKEKVYLSLIEQLQEARVAENSELGYVEVVDEALVPERPVSPRVPLNLALGGVLGLILGIGLAFGRHALDNKVHRPDELKKNGHGVIGVVPDMSRVIDADFEGRERIAVDGRSYSTRLITLLNPLSPIAESYRRLRTNLRFSRPDSVLKTVMVTSSEPGEGKSVTSMNLAIAMAQTGRRTVYIDADLRRSTGHKLMGVAREPGLVDVLFESYPTGMDRFATEVDDLYVVPAGNAPPNPSELLGSKKMQDFIARLEKEFDAVVIDTPPVLAVADALLLAPQCDATVLVCKAGATTWQALEHSAESLRDVGAETAGVLLNHFDAQSSAYGSYEYGYGYGAGEETSATTPV